MRGGEENSNISTIYYGNSEVHGAGWLPANTEVTLDVSGADLAHNTSGIIDFSISVDPLGGSGGVDYSMCYSDPEYVLGADCKLRISEDMKIGYFPVVGEEILSIEEDEVVEELGEVDDAVLDAIMAEYLFKKYPLKFEGELTEMRSKLVSRERLGQLSRKLHLNELITINPHAHAKSAGGDAFEALVGAIFLDKGYEKTKKIVLKRIFDNYYNMDEIVFEESNFKSKILNWSQHHRKTVSFEHEVAEYKRDSRLYRVKLFIDGEVCSEGLDYTVKKAEQIAAERACEKLITSTEKASDEVN